MDWQTFDKFQAELLAEVIKMKDSKGREYANSEDRFANFRRLSGQLGIRDYQVAAEAAEAWDDAIQLLEDLIEVK